MNSWIVEGLLPLFSVFIVAISYQAGLGPIPWSYQSKFFLYTRLLGRSAPIFHCQHFLFVYIVKQKQKSSLGSCGSHNKFGPNRFSRFDVYWIEKKPDTQTDKQSSIYIEVEVIFFEVVNFFGGSFFNIFNANRSCKTSRFH